MTFAHHCVHTIPNSFLFVVSFLISWTPYAIVVFISTFISPTIISPIAGTLPGKFLTNKMYWLRQKWSFSLVLAIFAKSSICIVPSVYLMTSHDARPKCLQQRRKIKKPLSRAIWFRKLWIFFINQEIVMIEIEIRPKICSAFKEQQKICEDYWVLHLSRYFRSEKMKHNDFCRRTVHFSYFEQNKSECSYLPAVFMKVVLHFWMYEELARLSF